MNEILSRTAELIQSSPALAYLMALLGGMLSSANPCVLVTIPAVISYVGGYAGGSRRKAFVYSLTFVLGLAFTFTVLGLIAASTGRLIGDIGAYWTYIVAAVAMVMGLQLLGLYEIRFLSPERIKTDRTSLIGSFVLGMLFGLVASPCATPVLAVILTLVAVQGKVLYGGTLLFFYALGHCVLILLVGTFTGLAESFVQSKNLGRWSLVTKRAFGVLFIGVALYVLLL